MPLHFRVFFQSDRLDMVVYHVSHRIMVDAAEHEYSGHCLCTRVFK